MNLDYFYKVNNLYQSTSKQDTDLYLLNRYENQIFDDTIDYQIVKRNGEPFELIVIKDTDGNTYKRKIKSRPGQPFNLGDYIEWNGQTWLITLVDVDDKTHNNGYMYLCTHKLRWQDEVGAIHSEWVYMEDFTKYSSGREANGQLVVGDNQYGMLVPATDDFLYLRRDKRFIIDKILVDPDVYILTNRKVALDDYSGFGRGGLITLTFTVGSFDPVADVYMDCGNGEMGWICDYFKPDKPQPVTPTVNVFINGKSSLRAGYKRKYSVLFTDEDGKDITSTITNFTWNIVSDFVIDQIKGLDIYSIYLKTKEENIGKTFDIEIVMNGEAVATKNYMVTAD